MGRISLNYFPPFSIDLDIIDQTISSKLDFSISNSENVPFNLTIIDDTSVWLGVPDGTLIDYEQVQFWPLVIEVKVCLYFSKMKFTKFYLSLISPK